MLDVQAIASLTGGVAVTAAARAVPALTQFETTENRSGKRYTWAAKRDLVFAIEKWTSESELYCVRVHNRFGTEFVTEDNKISDGHPAMFESAEDAHAGLVKAWAWYNNSFGRGRSATAGTVPPLDEFEKETMFKRAGTVYWTADVTYLRKQWNVKLNTDAKERVFTISLWPAEGGTHGKLTLLDDGKFGVWNLSKKSATFQGLQAAYDGLVKAISHEATAAKKLSREDVEKIAKAAGLRVIKHGNGFAIVNREGKGEPAATEAEAWQKLTALCQTVADKPQKARALTLRKRDAEAGDAPCVELPIVKSGTGPAIAKYAREKGLRWREDKSMLFKGYYVGPDGTTYEVV